VTEANYQDSDLKKASAIVKEAINIKYSNKDFDGKLYKVAGEIKS
jgi:hypothetical protein